MCWDELSKTAATSYFICVLEVSPNCPVPLWEAVQDQQMDLTQAPFKLLLLLLSLRVGEILYTLFKSGVSTSRSSKSLQSCPTVCDPIDSSPPGSLVPGILRSRILEWVAISFPNAWKWKMKVESLCCVRLLATSWTAAYQAPPSVGFSRQEYWSGMPLPCLPEAHCCCC